MAILPQLILLQRTQNIDNLTGNYVALLGCPPPPHHHPARAAHRPPHTAASRV